MHGRRDDEQGGQVDEQEPAVEHGQVVVVRRRERKAVDPEVVQHTERREQHEQAERAATFERHADPAREARIRYGANENANADPRSSPESRV